MNHLLLFPRLRKLALAILRAYGGSVWVPSPSTCYQDSAGTVPGNQDRPVGKLLDLVGTNHAIQATSGYRPILRRSAAGLWYLEFDGIDDRLQLSVPILADDNAICVAARPSIVDATIRRLLSLNSAGSASIHPYVSNGTLYGGWTNDAGQSVTLNVGGAAPANSALVATLRKVGLAGSLRKNGVVIASDSAAPVGAATFTSATIGNRFAGDRPFAGYQYGEATLLGSVPDAQLKIVERYLGQLAGVTI